MMTISERPARPAYDAARLFVLLSGGALAAMVQLAILPSLTQMAAHFSSQGAGALDGPAIAQLVTTIAAPTMVLGAPLTGWLAERLGKRPVLLVSTLVYALSGVAGAFAPSLWMLFASRLLLGLASAGLGTVAMGLISEYFTRERRDRLIGWYSFIGSAGALLTLLAAGYLAEIDWRAPFALYLVGLLIFAVALPAIGETKREIRLAAIGDDGYVRKALWVFVLIVLISLVVYMATIQGPFLLAAKGLTSPATQAMVADLTTVGAMLGAYLFGLLRPRFGFTAVLMLTWVALGLGTVGLGLSNGVAAIMAFACLSGFGSGFMAPLTQSAVLDAVPPGAAMRGIGLAIGCIFLGQFIQPFVIAPLRAAAGVEGTFLWVGAAALAAGLLTAGLWLRQALRPVAAA